MSKKITVRGARVHNLKNIDIEIPRDKLVVVTGVSGSGKSSLAFDTIFAEGQRRFVESLSPYARQFLGMMEKPDVDSIDGLSPAISIDQKTTHKNPRSTVGTVTEIYDYLRLLFAKAGTVFCPECGKKVEKQTASQIVNFIADLPADKKIMILAPLISGKKGAHRKILDEISREGFVRFRADGEIYSIAEEIELDEKKAHSIEVVVDRLKTGDFGKKFEILPNGEEIEIKNENRSRLADSVELALKKGDGKLILFFPDEDREEVFSEDFACAEHGNVVSQLQPRDFSFNSPYGACGKCKGLGETLVVDEDLVLPPNSKLTLEEGAIVPWANLISREESYNRQVLAAVAEKFNFNLKTRAADLTAEQREIILRGAGDETFKVEMKSKRFSGKFEAKFEGVAANLERRFTETASDFSQKQIEKFLVKKKCPDCGGSRLKKEILSVKIPAEKKWKNIIEICEMQTADLKKFFEKLPAQFSEKQNKIANLILKEIVARLEFLQKVGLGFLTLNRAANTLSGGEAQRIRLATQIGSQLQGVLYVLDEPTIGLHPRDNAKLISTLRNLQKIGNTVLVVEHDEEMMREADYLIEIGPAAGRGGGKVVAADIPENFLKNENSPTAQFLSGREEIPIPKKRRKIDFVNPRDISGDNSKN